MYEANLENMKQANYGLIKVGKIAGQLEINQSCDNSKKLFEKCFFHLVKDDEIKALSFV